MDYVDYLKRNLKSLESIAYHTPKKAQDAIHNMKYICENCDGNNQVKFMQKNIEDALGMHHGTASIAINVVLVPAGIIKTEGRSPATITLQDPLTPIETGTQKKFIRQLNETFEEIVMQTMCWSEEKKKYGYFTMSKEMVALYQEKKRIALIQQFRDTIEYLLKDMGVEKMEWDSSALIAAPEAE